MVPFRLTRNLVHAMGATGHEGPFRAACEACLGLTRRRRDLLMCALRPFYHDPLLDWVQALGGGEGGGRGRGGGGRRRQVEFHHLFLSAPVFPSKILSFCFQEEEDKESVEEAGNEKAVEALSAIEARLDGVVSAAAAANKKPPAGAGAAPSGSSGRRGAAASKIIMPLSVAGQVGFLVEEATSQENLSQMYLGWASYY